MGYSRRYVFDSLFYVKATQKLNQSSVTVKQRAAAAAAVAIVIFLSLKKVLQSFAGARQKLSYMKG